MTQIHSHRAQRASVRTPLGAWLRAAAMVPLLAIGTLLLGALSTPAVAQEQTWKINVKNADLQEFVAQVADITGNTIVVAPQLKGKVTVVSNANLDQDGVYTLFLSVLRTHGYTAVQSGSTIRVEQQAKGKQNPGANGSISRIAPDELVTRVISAQNVESTELMKILRPLIPQYGHIAAVTQPNVVIITDHADNIKRLIRIITQIDVSDEEEIVMVPLKEAWVGNVVALLEQVAPEQLGRNGKGPQKIQLIANERNNTLVLRGKPSPVSEILKLVETLDQPATTIGSTQVFYLKHGDAMKIAEIINGLVGQGNQRGSQEGSQPSQTTIQADESLNAIVVRAEPGVMSEIQGILNQLDVRRTQVLIEAAIAEISLTDQFNLGVEMAGVDAQGETVPLFSTATGGAINSLLTTLVGSTVSTDGGDVTPDFLGAAGAATSPTLAAAKIDANAISFGVIVNALASNRDSNLLSTPSILTLDNEEAKIVVGEEVPFRTGSFTTSTDGASNPFTTIQREDVAIQLTVTPHIHDGSSVRLQVAQEVEDVVPSAVGDGGFADVVTSKRTIETTVLAEDGETIVLGGLIQDDITTTRNKVPLLGDLPLLGRLFRTDTDTREKRTLLVFLRPTIVRDENDARELTRRKYAGIYEVEIRSRNGGEKGTIEEEMERLFQSPEL
ncbi:MAG: type II secretion system secretin GspD [Pseudomonadota bacterium]